MATILSSGISKSFKTVGRSSGIVWACSTSDSKDPMSIIWKCFRLRLYLSTRCQLRRNQPRPVNCNKSETNILVSDWLQLTCLRGVADKVTSTIVANFNRKIKTI